MSEGDDALWPRAGQWLAAGRGADRVGLAVLGVPLAKGALTPGRFDLAPAAFRQALNRFSTWDFTAGQDVSQLAVSDFGDLRLQEAEPEAVLEPVAGAVSSGLGRAAAMVLLGGNNAITWAGAHGLSSDLARIGLLTLDAHLDLRHLDAGLNNGSPIRALLRDGLPGANVAQVGIQSFANSGAYARVAVEAGISVVPVDAARRAGVEAAVAGALDRIAHRADVIYVDLDLDVLDRAFAPATAGARPGGLTPAEVTAAVFTCGRHPRVVALDLVEVDPSRDVADVTVLAAGRAFLAFASGLLARLRSQGDA